VCGVGWTLGLNTRVCRVGNHRRGVPGAPCRRERVSGGCSQIGNDRTRSSTVTHTDPQAAQRAATQKARPQHITPTAAWLLDRTESLCRADTTTGREDNGLPALRSLL